MSTKIKDDEVANTVIEVPLPRSFFRADVIESLTVRRIPMNDTLLPYLCNAEG